MQLETELLLFGVACWAGVCWHSCFFCWARGGCARGLTSWGLNGQRGSVERINLDRGADPKK